MNKRPLVAEDALAVARLWHAGAIESSRSNAAFFPRMSVKHYADHLKAEVLAGDIFGWGLFSTEDERLFAYITAKVVAASVHFVQDAHLFVLDVDVAADQRRRGHATRLLALAREHAESLGMTRLELGWITDDVQASAVWTKLGVRPYLARGYIDLPKKTA